MKFIKKVLKRARDWFFGATLWVERRVDAISYKLAIEEDDNNGIVLLILFPIHLTLYGLLKIGNKLGFTTGVLYYAS